MKIIEQKETMLKCSNEQKDILVYAKWDGCCDIHRYHNGYTYEDVNVPANSVDCIHICDLRKFIHFLTKIADTAEQIEGFEGYEKDHEQNGDHIKISKQDYIQLNPLILNELEKAMIGRGVNYETIQLILRDFDVRVKHLYSGVYNKGSK